MTSRVLALAALLLLLPTSAAAREADGQLWEETALAEAYWAERGVDTCELVIPGFETNDTQWFGWSDEGSCRLTLHENFAPRTRTKTSIPRLVHECSVVTHETGHALGLTHDDAGRFSIMKEDPDIFDTPQHCKAWGRRIATIRRADAAARRAGWTG